MRTRLFPSTLLFATMVLLAGCRDHDSAPTETPSLSGIRIVPDSIVLALGEETPLRAVLVRSDGSESPVTPGWYSLDGDGAVALDPGTANMTGVRAGRAIVTARSYLFTASAPVIVLPPTGFAATGALRVDEFWIEEFLADYEYRVYAPHVRVFSTGGGERLLTAVVRDWDDPLASLLTLKCQGSVLANQSVYLSREVNGVWTFAFSVESGRLYADSATVEVNYLTPEGKLVTTSARGPIRRGGAPSTFTRSVENAGPCWSQ